MAATATAVTTGLMTARSHSTMEKLSSKADGLQGVRPRGVGGPHSRSADLGEELVEVEQLIISDEVALLRRRVS